MTAPTLRPDGSCPECKHGWVCTYHQQEGVRREREQAAHLRRVLAVARDKDLARCAAELELESDEFETWREKAARFLGVKL